MIKHKGYQKTINFRFWTITTLSCILGLYSPVNYAQTNSNANYSLNNRPQVNIIPPSPEVATLGKFGEVPVGYYTGAVNLSIPIATISNGNIKVPISLDYSSGSGIRVGDIANSAGLGWMINGVCAISRTVRNKADDRNGFLNEIANYGLSFFNDPSSLSTVDSYKNRLLEYYQNSHGCSDFQPDIFNFNFLGYSGQFFMGWDGRWVIKSKDAIKIEYTKSASQQISGWTITTPDGNKYLFNEVETMYSNTFPIPDDVLGDCPQFSFFNSSWFLSAIISPQKERVDFNYESNSYSLNNVRNETVAFMKAVECPPSPIFCQCSGYLSGDPASNTPLGNAENSGSVDHYYTKRLKSISNSSSDSLIFYYYTDRADNSEIDSISSFKSLDSMVLKNNNNILKSWGLVHDYSTGRLTLKKLRIKDGILNTDNEYALEYNEAIPAKYNSNAQDHWGYYNGQDDNISLVPTCFSIDTTEQDNGQLLTYYDGANRSVSKDFSLKGLLTKITYPTGGYSNFTYEVNDCHNINGMDVDSINNFHRNQDKGVSHTLNALAGLGVQEIKDTFQLQSTAYGIVNYDFYVNQPNTAYGNVSRPLITIRKIENDGTTSLIDQQQFDIVENQSQYGLTFGVIHTKKVLRLPIGKYALYMKVQDYGADTLDRAQMSLKYNETIYNEPAGNILVGGARIKTITNYDPYSGATTKKEISYLIPGTTKSSGCIQQMPNYENGIVKNYLQCVTGSNVPEFATHYYNKLLYTSQNYALNGITSGNHIGYSWVTITEPGKGKSEMHYTSPALYPGIVNVTYPFVPQPSISYRVGQLIDQNQYKWINGNYYLSVNAHTDYKVIDTSVIDYNITYWGTSDQYQFMLDPLSSVYGDASTTDALNALQNLFTVKLYSIRSGYSLPVSQTETNYLSPLGTAVGTNAVSTTKYFRYRNDYPSILASDSTVNSDGKTHRNDYGYAMDETASPVITAMVGHNMVGLPLSTRNYVSNVLTQKSKTNYGLYNGADTIIAPQNIQFATANNPLVTQLVYNKYDNKGHVLSYTERDNKTTFILWGYNNTYPVVEIHNVTDTAAFSSYMAANAGLQSTFNAPSSDATLLSAVQQLRSAFPLAMITGYTYKPLTGVTGKTDPNNIKTTYEYDAMGRLSIVRDFNGNILKKYSYSYQDAQ